MDSSTWLIPEQVLQAPAKPCSVGVWGWDLAPPLTPRLVISRKAAQCFGLPRSRSQEERIALFQVPAVGQHLCSMQRKKGSEKRADLPEGT